MLRKGLFLNNRLMITSGFPIRKILALFTGTEEKDETKDSSRF
jgi:hypothetical protein